MATTTNGGFIDFANNGFNTKYVIDNLKIEQLKGLLCDQTFMDNLSLLFANPSDYINSLKFYPIQLSSFFGNTSTNQIKIGNISNTNIYGGRVSSINRRVLISTLNISRKYHNFMDFEPYTKVELYIPYFSFMSLPVNEVMGKTIYIYLSIDFDSGIGTIYIECGGKVIMTNSTKLGIDIPLGASNLNDVVKDNFANGLKVIAGITTMAVAPTGKMTGALLTAKGISMAITSGIDAVANSQVRYTRGSLTGGTDMLASPNSVYAIITRPNPITISSNYNKVKGKPLGEVKTLSTMRGFTIVEQIHLNGFDDALDEEVREIEKLLKEGVEF